MFQQDYLQLHCKNTIHTRMVMMYRKKEQRCWQLTKQVIFITRLSHVSIPLDLMSFKGNDLHVTWTMTAYNPHYNSWLDRILGRILGQYTSNTLDTLSGNINTYAALWRDFARYSFPTKNVERVREKSHLLECKLVCMVYTTSTHRPRGVGHSQNSQSYHQLVHRAHIL